MPPTTEQSQGGQQPDTHPESTDDPSGINTSDDQPKPICSIESLPAELSRKIILNLIDLGGLEALGALVFASPGYFRLYLLERRILLRTAIQKSLGNYVPEAFAVQASASLYRQRNPAVHLITITGVITTLTNYRLHDDQHPDTPNMEDALDMMPEDFLTGMASFYRSVARPLVRECAARFLQHIDPSLEVGELSAMEQTRLLRALYRFQLWCNMFGDGRRASRKAPPHKPQHARQFFSDPFIVAITEDVFESQPEAVATRPPSPNPPVDWPIQLCKGTAERGLWLVHRVLNINDHNELVRTMATYHGRKATFDEELESLDLVVGTPSFLDGCITRWQIR
ncbi:uncharacterized protein C8A04DRAFT_28017 [Dichotomopilus funicola]|uniref:Uncharacterized protein n=1 Tax=Dichotomopilus funicola TaxID=1934379 RepID=A0AAN6V3Z8_9PEZI|nr:hypothetical protein C8A04DRAFT_28017 [Dichotomopilus funicola]